jgi:hypothetical protein
MHQVVSEAVAASLAEATPDSLGSHNYHHHRAAGPGMSPATQRHAAPECCYPGTRRKLATADMSVQKRGTVGPVVMAEMARGGWH